MDNIMIFGVIMAILAFIFWTIELWPFIKFAKQQRLEPSTNYIGKLWNTIKYNGSIAVGFPLLIPVAFDLIITTSLTSIFSFGGMVGGIIGLLMSNLFSLLIIFITHITID